MNKDLIWLSIIIPVYNSEKYIEKCLVSCVKQDIDSSNYEIILINDGSTDNSLEIINNFIVYYDNFTVLNSSNEGASSARNKGLDIAKGKYIWFVDSDDWIETNCLSSLLSILDNEELDALQIGFNIVTKENTIYKYLFSKKTGVLEPINYVLPDHFRGATCGTIFRREICVANSIRFDKDLSLAEDQLFLLSIFYYSKRVKREDYFVYYYRTNPYSLTNNATEEQLYQSSLKISTFRFRNFFNIYIGYILIINIISLLEIAVNSSRLNEYIINHRIVTIINYKYLTKNELIKIWLYKCFGIFFLNLYFRVRNYKIHV